MKYCIILLLLSFFTAQSQNTMTADDKQILYNEIVRNVDSFANQESVQRFIKDSILINSKVLKPKKMKAIKAILNTDNITDNDRIEIFGLGDENRFIDNPLKTANWQQDAFADLKVSLFTKSKYKGRKDAINALYGADMISISRPLINADRTYALVETMSNKKGRMLTIYKWSDKGWMFFKDIVLS